MDADFDVPGPNRRFSPQIRTLAHHLVPALIVAATLALCMITIDHGHNWGGDFSGYIMQAKSITELSPSEFVESNRLRMERTTPIVGPAAYPWGFPVLLAPVYSIFGLNIYAMKMVGVLSYLGLLIVMWYGFQSLLSPLWRSVCLLLFALNPTLIDFNNNILSDIPFLLVSTFSVCLIGRIIVERRTLWSPMADRFLLGAVIAIATFIRTPGLLLLAVVLWSQMSVFFSLRRDREELDPMPGEAAALSNGMIPANLIAWLTPLVPYACFGVLTLLWRSILPDGGAEHVDDFERVGLRMLKGHAIYYWHLGSGFFSGEPSYYGHGGRWIVYACSLPFFFVGAIRHLRNQHYVLFYILLNYALLIAWPHLQGIRYLFPILPFYILFCVSGLSFFARGDRKWVRLTSTLLCLLPTAYILLYFGAGSIGHAREQLHKGGVIETGPFSAASSEMFEFIRTNTGPEESVIFFKPRVMGLLAERHTLRVKKAYGVFSGDYVCFFMGKRPFNIEQMWSLIEASRAEEVFSNEDFAVFKLHPKGG